MKLVLEKACRFGEGFYVVGNHPVLGDWNVDAAVPMDWSEGHIWSAEVVNISYSKFFHLFHFSGWLEHSLIHVKYVSKTLLM